MSFYYTILNRKPNAECTLLETLYFKRASFVAQLVKNWPAMQGTWVWIIGLGRSPGERKDYPLQYSGLENSMDCIVNRVAKSWTWLSDFHSLTLRIIVTGIILTYNKVHSSKCTFHKFDKCIHTYKNQLSQV